MIERKFAFVIMPFGDDFDPIYEKLIKPAFSENGYEVKRADDIESQQNILRDIVQSIHNSDLIVADLTTTNPNVFYELGLAHAFRKPVILITQSIEEVPFDLKSYRLLKYSVHFAQIDEAKEKLVTYARGALDESIEFGSPVTDFYSGESSENQEECTESLESDQGKPGFLDHFIAINDGYGRIADIAETVGCDFEELTRSMNVASDDFKRINANRSATSLAAARQTSRKLATKVSDFTSRLKDANGEYSSIAAETEDSLEFVVSFRREHSDELTPGLHEELESLRSLKSVVRKGRDTLLTLADDMDDLPRIERRLNREVARASEEIRVMASNLDRTIASISRALGEQG